MARITGKEGIVKFDDTAVTMARDWSLDQTGDTVEDTVIGDGARTFKPTLNSASGSVNLYYDEEDVAADGVNVGDEVEMELYPDGEAEGATLFEFTAIITSKGKSAAFDGMTERTIAYQVSGEVTKGTVPTP